MKATIDETIIRRYLEGNATSSEKQELLLWLQESKEHEREFLVYYDVWSMLHQCVFDPQMALNKIYSPRPQYKRIVLWSVSIAASIAIALGVWLGIDRPPTESSNIRDFAQQFARVDANASADEEIRLILSDEKQVKMKDKKETIISYADSKIEIDEEQTVSKTEVASFNQLITPYGKRGTLILEDGTKIWVNANSRLIYPARFADDRREVYVDGEIYLEVMPDKNRPFIVKTDRMNVQVLGTSFSISAYGQEDNSRVILASGAVNISSEENKKEKFVLSPNEMYELSATGEAKVVQVPDVTRYTSWINGIYPFERESLASILDLMESFYGYKIEAAPDAGALTCSGKLRLNDNFVSTLEGLTETLPIQIENRNNTYYIMKIIE